MGLSKSLISNKLYNTWLFPIYKFFFETIIFPFLFLLGIITCPTTDRRMPWRGLEPPRFVAQDFESRVSTISPPKLFIFQLYIKNLEEFIYWGGGGISSIWCHVDIVPVICNKIIYIYNFIFIFSLFFLLRNYSISWGIGEEGGMNSE